MAESGQLRDDDERYEVDFLRKGHSGGGGGGRGTGDAGPSYQGRDERAIDTTGLAVGGTGGSQLKKWREMCCMEFFE